MAAWSAAYRYPGRWQKIMAYEKIAPPNLPLSPQAGFTVRFFEQFSNALRLFFNRLMGTVNELVSVGWADMTSSVSSAGVPSNQAPTTQNFGPDAVPLRRELAFDVNDYVYLQPFHVNHDIVPNNCQAFLHVHWSTNGTNTQPVRWEFLVSRALGHNQANFGPLQSIIVTGTPHGTAWRHYVTEVTDLDDVLILTEPDELINVTLRRITNGGTNNTDRVFGLTVDLHYQTDRRATPQKAPNFYAERL